LCFLTGDTGGWINLRKGAGKSGRARRVPKKTDRHGPGREQMFWGEAGSIVTPPAKDVKSAARHVAVKSGGKGVMGH